MKRSILTLRYVKASLAFLIAATFLLTGATANAQDEFEMPTPSPEMDFLKKDVGAWDCTVKFWEDPNAAPLIDKATETNRMLGGFWLLADFQGKVGGLEFAGHGTYGYDAEKKQYVGTWMDSLTPFAMQMTGKVDKATETITYTGQGPGMDGKLRTHTLATCYKDGKRVMTMHVESEDGTKNKVMEITYTKKE